MNLQPLKGFRDFLPEQARKREFVINTLKKVFSSYGFEPLETPSLEKIEILMGKYGQEADKLIYRFQDLGKREVGLRYDLTVPLSRVIAINQNLPLPFKRYQIQTVWRADKPQSGRFREFTQCDADIVGSKSLIADTEIILMAKKALEKLGFKKFIIYVNDRWSLFQNLSQFKQLSNQNKLSICQSLDKIKKIGKDGVIKELEEKGFKEAEQIIKIIGESLKSKDLNIIFDNLKKMGLEEEIKFDPYLTRGLDYYTNMIFEIYVENYQGGSLAGGGRYDTLIGFSAEKYLPAVGFSFGIDRLIEVMEKENLFKNIPLQSTQVLVTVFSQEYLENSLQTVSLLRNKGISVEIYLNEEKLDKQIKYADKKGIRFVIILGPNEVKKNEVTIKDLSTGSQRTITLKEIDNFFLP
ncbi:MAG: histidine--tRNA ligase [Candidatus Shapirobacteria bacterium]|nr:histidine--tRNA ligase [Candidatus Shapirobacteria bacterium]